MDTNIFWEIIGHYNSQTKIIQIVLFALLVISFVLSYMGKIKWLVKLTLGIINIYIGIVFFGYYGTEKIQKYFALPLFIICGLLFIFECIKNKNDEIEKNNKWQIILSTLYVLYPIISVVLGNRFPKMTTHIMPCPIISISIIIYSGYRNKGKLLLFVMLLWGLTGVKAFFANAYEDIILLICGIYCMIIIFKQYKIVKNNTV
jgi:nitrate reductase NapE component